MDSPNSAEVHGVVASAPGPHRLSLQLLLHSVEALMMLLLRFRFNDGNWAPEDFAACREAFPFPSKWGRWQCLVRFSSICRPRTRTLTQPSRSRICAAFHHR